MKFAYTYRSSDGQRHSAEIEAESRDAAFVRLRSELGIRAIRVTALDGEEPNDLKGSKGSNGLNGLKGPIGLIGLALAIIVGLWWWLAGERDARPYQVMTSQGPVTYTIAQPLPRQMIPGDRERIENGKWRTETAKGEVGNGAWGTGNGEWGTGDGDGEGRKVKGEKGNGVFQFAAEAYLARFAEPGRPIRAKGEGLKVKGDDLPTFSPSHLLTSFKTCLTKPIRIASTDFTEVVDLKRIVTGMKLEMRAYLAGGGTVEQYLVELEKRQRLEISYRENAERRLNEMLDGTSKVTNDGRAASPRRPNREQLASQNSVDPDGSASRPYHAARQESAPYRAAYEYWLKANAQLQAMGIYPLALPDALRAYQMGLELEN